MAEIIDTNELLLSSGDNYADKTVRVSIHSRKLCAMDSSKANQAAGYFSCCGMATDETNDLRNTVSLAH